MTQTQTENGSNPFVGRDPKFLEAIQVAIRVAKSTASILLTGESGTGKEIFARFIHSNSLRSNGPFTAINCASIPENLLESEFFGHAKGAFTGACERRTGLFEASENGTLFLDEIGDLSLQLQAKILRVLQEKKIKRIGENTERPINCRIISATHKDLNSELKENRFREDLYFRLNVIPISIPPLRERKGDSILLAESFLIKFAKENDSNARSFSPQAIDYILNNRWQGNVRELENTIERAVILCEGQEISISNFNLNSNSEDDQYVQSTENTFSIPYFNQLPQLDEVINRYINYAVEKNGGARDKTAKEIGIDRKTLYKRFSSQPRTIQ